MPDLNVMLLEHAKSGLQAELDTAVTNGDTEAARKVADRISALNSAAAPKPSTAYGDTEIRVELNKLPWFGVDPKKSGRTIELGKTMDPKKFGNAADFTAALVKVVDEEFKTAVKNPPENETDEEREARETKEEADAATAAKEKKPRASDGPSDGDTNGAARTRRTATGPWVKMSDAPADVQKEINRTADKFAPKTKEGREKYVAKALEAHYNKAQLAKGKK